MKPRPVHYLPSDRSAASRSLCNQLEVREGNGNRWTRDTALVTCPNCKKHSCYPQRALALRRPP